MVANSKERFPMKFQFFFIENFYVEITLLRFARQIIDNESTLPSASKKEKKNEIRTYREFMFSQTDT